MIKTNKWVVLIFIALLCISCASVSTIKTTVTTPKGNIYAIQSKSDASVAFKNKDVEFTVDNKKRLGIIESIFGVLILKTDINLSNQEGTQ